MWGEMYVLDVKSLDVKYSSKYQYSLELFKLQVTENSTQMDLSQRVTLSHRSLKVLVLFQPEVWLDL